MLSYLDYLVFLHAVFLHRTTLCIPYNHFQHVFAKKKVENNLPILHGLQTYQNGGSSKCSHISTIWCFCRRFFAQNNSMHSVESFSACFCEKKKVENNLPILHGAIDLPKWRIFKMLSYLDYLVFLHAVFCTEQLYAFRRIIFSMFLRKKKLKITCPFCMGYRLTKMEDLQNALISRLFGVFARGFLHRTTLCIPQNHFQHVFANKKIENNLPVLHGLQTYQNGRSSKCSHISPIWCFCARFFCTEQLYAFRTIIFSMFLRKKKVENNLHILHGLQTYQNGGSSKCSHISTIWCFCTEQLYAFRRIIFSMFLRKKKLKITCSFCMGYRLTKMEDLQNALISRLFGVFAGGFFYKTILCIPQKSFFSMSLRKKKYKITCPFCMGYRLTKMEDLQNALISRLFGVFARGFLHRTTLCIPQNNFQHVFAKKKS